LKKLIDHLFLTHAVQVSVLPEFISFLSKNKGIIRIVVDNSDNPFDLNLFHQAGFIVSEKSLFSQSIGNSFGNLISEVNGLNKNEYTEVKMFSIARDKYALDSFEKAEIEGDVLKAGTLLGYPSCCVNNVEQINQLGANWGLYYLDDYHNNNKASLFTNRFPIAWGGISIVGELFPCSLSCKNAIEYSKSMIIDLKKFGFNNVADKCIEHSSRTIYIHSSKGNINIDPVLNYKEIKFN